MFSSSTPFTMPVTPAGTNGFGGSWGDGAWWIIILLIFCFGGWGNGYGNNGSGALDNYVLNSDFATLSRQIDSGFTNTNGLITNQADQLQRQVTSVANGLSSLGYDQLNQMNGVNNNIFASTNSLTAGITALSSKMQECCCQNRYDTATQFAQLNYNLADQSCQTRRTVEDATRDIITNQDANTRSILDFLTQDKIATLSAENASLKAAADNAAQTNAIVSQLRVPNPVPAFTVPSPYATYCGCSCGCNC